MLRYIEIYEIPDNGYEINEQVSCSAIDFGDEFKIIGPIGFNAAVVKVNTDVIVSGNIEFSVNQVCSLCLEGFDSGFKNPFRIEFKSSSAEPDNEEKELGEEELDVIYLRGTVIDLFDIIREQILLAIPIKPVCKSECLGLCYKCGSNLNIEKCGCDNEKKDMRFSVLEGLKVKN